MLNIISIIVNSTQINLTLKYKGPIINYSHLKYKIQDHKDNYLFIILITINYKSTLIITSIDQNHHNHIESAHNSNTSTRIELITWAVEVEALISIIITNNKKIDFNIITGIN